MAKKKKSEENQENVNDADNFGLPDLEYKPLDTPEEPPVEKVEERVTEETFVRDQSGEEMEREQRSTYSYTMEEEKKSNAPVIISIVIILVLVIGGFLVYKYVWVPQKEKEKLELVARQKAQAEREQRARDEQARLEAEEKARLAAAAAVPATPSVGTIETLSDRTQRYYVVVSSAIDDDLVMDYAKKLSAQGVSTKIIPPFGNYKFSRLAIGDFDTYANAQTSADASKADYGDAVWVLRF